MIVDLGWLSTEAHKIHEVFTNLFFMLATVLLLLGVLTEYFKMPLGGVTPDVLTLVGRVVVATFLLVAFPDIANTLSDFTDALAKSLGEFNNVHMVLDRMSGKLDTMSWNWVSVKETITVAISFVSFFILYISVYIASAGVSFVWSVLYVFSPLLICLFILPVTAVATKALFRALIEVCFWKIAWAVLATLLWSFAVSNINDPQQDVNFLTVISLNLILAGSILFTPIIVSSLIGNGLTSLGSTLMGMAAASSALAPGGYMAKGISQVKDTGKGALLKLRGGSGGGNATQFSAQSLRREKAELKVKTEISQKIGSPPEHFSRIPPPREPPGWLLKKLDREKRR